MHFCIIFCNSFQIVCDTSGWINWKLLSDLHMYLTLQVSILVDSFFLLGFLYSSGVHE